MCEARGARMRGGAASEGVGRTAVQRERGRNALGGAGRERGVAQWCSKRGSVGCVVQQERG